ncbi:DUF3870 domain-containing protein [Alteribacillus iranensis]|uniref:DUF3870 domain-containing protein n=1 Tax=Alteribacillus iranensis TaxID=930128 RepID=UPI002ADDE18C|nr:DUF3870 domain-containing protein [Alteribacillus iranensis]
MRQLYPKETVYIVGEAKSPQNNPITKQYHTFFVGFVIDETNNRIVDVDCTSILGLTKRFIQDLFIGEVFWDSETIIQSIEKRYLGSSQKALIVAYKNAKKKYRQALDE